MKKIIIALISLTAFQINLSAQSNIDSVLAQIERNNTTLAALQKRADADKIGNKTGNYLQNPEIEFNYLWGNEVTGNRTDFSAKQTFDFPTAYRYKNQISNIKNEQVELEYQKQRKELLLNARLICYDLIYTNALKLELTNRLNHAQSIADAYKSKFDIGETNRLEYNKAQLNWLNLSKTMESLTIEQEALQAELTRLNGGALITFTESDFQAIILPVDFEQWYVQAEQSNPLLNWLKKEVELTQKQISLNKALSMPKFQAGYMSESVIGQDFKGITVGLSIPLWENKNTVKYAKADALALENTAADNKIQLYSHLKMLHTKAISLQKSANDYKSKLEAFNNSELLRKALDKGEISLINYMLELSIYYESVNKLLELERDMNKAIAELNQYL
ncbi:MAG: transporter [Bacteroidetes bacterium CG18_big_fil_WC_8_21_14_2_50_41_14]|nr:MAG: transporter [Bacteroidetes bacterium CG18_big_fil_WC_8_21_14_2_50_41_14]PJB58770.1 MAG: transporter [Bacteroidetes bacterium CG_4_9_14_3_um_filter_41_19]